MSDTVTPAPEPGGPGNRWFAVDGARISRLPERLRALWPHELLPRAVAAETTSAGAGAAVTTSGSGQGATETVVLGDRAGRESKRGLDVLTAWLTGFAAELNLARSRITIVISSGSEIVHLEVSLCDDICLAILMLHGEGFAEFSGFELLRRLRVQELGQVAEELCSLVEDDCVLTLTYLSETKAAGMEFLHRVDGVWARPSLEREGTTVTVGTEHHLGADAVRVLLAATLTSLRTLASPGTPSLQRPSTTGRRR